MHRSQGAATQSKQQYQGIYVPNMHQSQSTITQSAKQFQGISVQNMHQSLDATTQSAQQSDQDKYDKVLKDIDASLVEQKKLKGAMLLPGGNAFKAQKEEFDTKVPILQSYSEVARRIMWEYMYGQSIGAWISKSLNSYMQNAKII
ncbi:hypothetical protein BASA62_006788 [Batrachochytrium salamandrivorans]|nr:hypothetical protein BASA62_006788 [Batrachochytrium salamandrivorans]